MESESQLRRETSRGEMFPNGASYIVVRYWEDFYSFGGHCTLCEDTGIIDTSDKPHGRKNFCVCPDGQKLRKDR